MKPGTKQALEQLYFRCEIFAQIYEREKDNEWLSKVLCSWAENLGSGEIKLEAVKDCSGR